MKNTKPTRIYPMRKPDGHCPVVQRYSSSLDSSVSNVRVVVFGQQGQVDGFQSLVRHLFASQNAPDHRDAAHYTDPQGVENTFTVAYWLDPISYSGWREDFDAWLATQDPKEADSGYWLETFSVPTPYRETIAFKEYLRGLSACPYSTIEPIEESAYWGAARDRFAASAYDTLGPADDQCLSANTDRDTRGKVLRVVGFPDNLCVIRSGVSWASCGEEQLESYQKNLAPKLDAGMQYLRDNPSETGCASLRQVSYLNADGTEAAEAFSLGFFLSFSHLERWAEKHPSHLAIYTKALAERKKYQENLELKTYHEIYVLSDDAEFLYFNCHPSTGLLPYFENSQV